MSDEKMRAEFEAAVTKDSMEAGFDEPNFSRTRCYPESYWDESIQTAWWAWQASRAALVIELPESYPRHRDSYIDVMDAELVVEAIEEAGVRVK